MSVLYIGLSDQNSLKKKNLTHITIAHDSNSKIKIYHTPYSFFRNVCFDAYIKSFRVAKRKRKYLVGRYYVGFRNLVNRAPTQKWRKA